MNRYIIVETNTGYIFGDEIAESPLQACEQMRAKIGGEAQPLEQISIRNPHALNGRDGFVVHEVPADFPVVEDGQDNDTIDAATAYPIVAVIVGQDDNDA